MVIGSGLGAALYALLNGHVLIQNVIESPHRFDFLNPETPTFFFGITNEPTHLMGENEERVVGIRKSDLWERSLYALSIRGLLPFADKVDTIRLAPENKLSVMTTGNKKYDIEYDELKVFDSRHVEGMELCEFPPAHRDKKLVLDWFNVRSGCTHRFDFLCQPADFVKEVYFYASDRIAGSHDKKDLVTLSYLNEDELRDPDYSSVPAKYRILNWMKELGIKGQSNGRDPSDPTKRKHYAIRIEHARRQVLDDPCDEGEIEEALREFDRGGARAWNRST